MVVLLLTAVNNFLHTARVQALNLLRCCKIKGLKIMKRKKEKAMRWKVPEKLRTIIAVFTQANQKRILVSEAKYRAFWGRGER